MKELNIIPYFFTGFVVVTFLFSVLINGIFLKFSSTLGIRTPQDPAMVRWVSQAKPSVGGISFFIVYLLSLTCYAVFFDENNMIGNIRLIGQMTALILAFLMGLADDAYNTRPLLKFLIQTSCGLILVVTGTTIELFGNETVNGIVTVLWVVGLMNSINMLDNMDSITSIVSLAILATAFCTALLTEDFPSANHFLIAGISAAIGGFLVYNWNPAKIYMGDTGSQFLGCMLAIIGIIYFWNAPGTEASPLSKLLITVTGFILALTDTTTVVINRIARGQSPFVGGKDHTTHHLSYAGFSDKAVARIFLALSTLSGALVFIMVKNPQELLPKVVSMVFALSVFTTLFLLTKKKRGVK